MNLLFLCVANSARSQIAEGLAKKILGAPVKIFSAGSQPGGYVHPLAIEVMREIGIDLSSQYSKSVDSLDLGPIDQVITLCAEEICPVYLGKAKKLHWPISDPASQTGSQEERLNAFRRARDEIQQKIIQFKEESSL